MKICVFCSANQQIDPEFFAMTEELGKWVAKNGHSIVYGGVNQGLMEGRRPYDWYNSNDCREVWTHE